MITQPDFQQDRDLRRRVCRARLVTDFARTRTRPIVKRVTVACTRIVFFWATSHYSRDTALHYASSYGQIAVVKLLLEHDANMDARCNESRTSLHEAAN